MPSFPRYLFTVLPRDVCFSKDVLDRERHLASLPWIILLIVIPEMGFSTRCKEFGESSLAILSLCS